MQEVHHEPFDVTAILILICHDHDLAIPQRLRILVLLGMLESNDLLECRNFGIVVNLHTSKPEVTHRIPGWRAIPFHIRGVEQHVLVHNMHAYPKLHRFEEHYTPVLRLHP